MRKDIEKKVECNEDEQKYRFEFEISDIVFPSRYTRDNINGEEISFSFRISSEELHVYTISIKEKIKEKKEWKQTFDDLSDHVEDERITLEPELILMNIVQAISSLRHTAENTSTTVLPNLLQPMCDISNAKRSCGDDILCLTLRIPFGVAFVTYKFYLESIFDVPAEILKENPSEAEQQQQQLLEGTTIEYCNMQRLKVALEDDINELRKENAETKKMLHAFMFRDAKALKLLGLDAVQLDKAGFSREAILPLFSTHELHKQGFHMPLSLKLHYYQGQGSNTESSNDRIKIKNQTATRVNGSGYRYVTTAHPLSKDKISFFKVTLHNFVCWIAVGIIGKRRTTNISFTDKTCYSWTGQKHVYVGGVPMPKENSNGWEGFQVKDQVFFRYIPLTKTLTMKLNRLGSNTAFSIVCDEVNSAYIHISLFTSLDKVSLAEMSTTEEDIYFGST